MKKHKAGKLGSSSLQLDDFFGRPKLSKGEDRIAYRKFRKAFRDCLKPEKNNLIDGLEVQEVIDCIWEAQRFQRMAPALVDSERRQAIEYLMDSSLGYVTEENEEWYPSFKGKPYPDDMTEAEVLEKVGLSEDLIQARSFLGAAQKIGVLDQFISSRIATRKALLKDRDRRKRQAVKDERQAAKDGRPAAREKSSVVEIEPEKPTLTNDNDKTETREKRNKKMTWGYKS
jgi:hypothetical protein